MATVKNSVPKAVDVASRRKKIMETLAAGSGNRAHATVAEILAARDASRQSS